MAAIDYEKEMVGTVDVPEADAHAVVSKMLLSHELHACWDQPTATLAVQRTEPSKLQFLALPPPPQPLSLRTSSFSSSS